MWFNHYFWVYSWVPLLGAVIAGFLSLIAQKVKKAGGDEDTGDVLKSVANDSVNDVAADDVM